MEHIGSLLPQAVASLEFPVREDPKTTKVWEKFSDFQTFDDPQLDKMKCEAVSFIDDLFNNRTPRWLSLLGSPGAGKTMLATRIWHLFRDHRHELINWPRTKETQCFVDGKPTKRGRLYRWRGGCVNWGICINNRMLRGEYEFLDDLCSWDFFVIDDIATEYEKHRGLSASKLYQIFNSRLGKWTVITANIGMAEISEALDPRIASRMLRNNSVVVDVDVPDFNLR